MRQHEIQSDLPEVHGRGRLKNACPSCHGDGRSAYESVDVRIPAGAQNGSRLRVAGKGNAGTWARPGDLYITTHVEQHPLPSRRRQHPVKGACNGLGSRFGAKIEVPTIDGKSLLKIPPGTQNNQKFRLRERVFSIRAKARAAISSATEVMMPDYHA